MEMAIHPGEVALGANWSFVTFDMRGTMSRKVRPMGPKPLADLNLPTDPVQMKRFNLNQREGASFTKSLVYWRFRYK